MKKNFKTIVTVIAVLFIVVLVVINRNSVKKQEEMADKMQLSFIVNGVEKGLVIASDGTRQAGIGDVVYMIGRKEAALLLSRDDPPPSDITIAGIIDPETL